MQSTIYSKSIFVVAMLIFTLGVIGLGVAMLIRSPGNTTTTSKNSESTTSTSTSSQEPTNSTGDVSTGASGYSTSQVASHNSASSCWLIVSSKVYDVTSYISGDTHKTGNQIILEYCGQDATSAFTVHKGSGYSELESYYIGNLN